MTYSVDITMVLDLPEEPTAEDVINAVMERLTKQAEEEGGLQKPAEVALDGVLVLTPEED